MEFTPSVSDQTKRKVKVIPYPHHTDPGGEITRRNFLQDLDSKIRTARETGSVLDQTMAKLAITPQDISDTVHGVIDIADNPGAVAKAGYAGIKELAHDPVKAAARMLDNPPASSTVLAALAPLGVLKAYREITPLHMRTYLHSLIGTGTPFTKVTERERESIFRAAKNQLDDLMEGPSTKLKLDYIKTNAQLKNSIRFGTRKELEEIASDNNISITQSRYVHDKKGGMGSYVHKPIPTERLRKELLDRVASKLDNNIDYTVTDPYNKRARAGVPWETFKGGRPKGFGGVYATYLHDVPPSSLNVEQALEYLDNSPDIRQAFGKAYITPKLENGKFVPDRLQDLYKFLDIYSFNKAHPIKEGIDKYINRIKATIPTVKNTLTSIIHGPKNTGIPADVYRSDKMDLLKSIIQEDLNPLWGNPGGDPGYDWLRRFAQNRPGYLVDIPLTPGKTGALNLHDKIAILMAAHKAGTNK
jgi:hypothetical protein